MPGKEKERIEAVKFTMKHMVDEERGVRDSDGKFLGNDET